MWKRELAQLKKRRRRQLENIIVRHETINVPFGVTVLYRNKELTFELSDGGAPFDDQEWVLYTVTSTLLIYLPSGP